MADLTKLVFHSNYPAFKNNDETNGSLIISGTVDSGINIQSFTVSLGFTPDYADVIFNGPPDGTYDSRPSDAWFKEGALAVPSTGPSDARFFISGSITGSTLTIKASYAQEFSGPDTLTPTTLYYKVVDYSTTRSSTIAFDSRLNYMKRSEFCGSEPLILPSSGLTVTKTVSHNLGYIPFLQVGANLDDDSIIWSNNQVYEYTQTSLTGVDPPVQLSYWFTDTDLTINLINGTGGLAQSGSRTVYWVIYLDYSS